MHTATAIAKGPDGKHWVILTFEDNLVSTALRLPADSADQLAKELPTLLGDAAELARREDVGLVVATKMPDVTS